ncbi:MAG: GNAT family N-acetyltransferase [Verrucomicrobia bacterium]|nr:GNAT family N-acetyltransferase [Verrucomicrobiota bacterium]
MRPPKSKDWPEYSQLIRKSKRLFQGVVSPFKNQHEFAAYVDRCRQDDYLGLFICSNEDHAILGTINLSQIVRGNFLNACIGYSIGAPFAGKGYMTEALQLVLRLAFEELDLHRIEANIQPHNEASIALVKRAGFSEEGFSPRYLKVCGRWRDHERWAILAEDWRTLRKIKNAKSR